VIERVAAAIERYKMLRFGRRIGVAVSGGADSVFLLRSLAELGLAACVIHINHQLRGAASDSDEAFVRDLAAGYGLDIFVRRQPVASGNLEQEARRARYEYFRFLIEQQHCDSVASGHTMDDQAETVFLRFLRGAGTAGLSAIRPVTDSHIVRPLLGLRREEIRDWLRSANLPWHEDCTNKDTGFDRNWLRLVIMPQLLERLNPSLPRTLASTADWAQGEEDYWTEELDRLALQYFQLAGRAILIRLNPFGQLPVAIQRRLVRRAVERVLGNLRSIDFNHIEGIRLLTLTREGSGRVQLPGLDVYRSFDWLRLAPAGMDSQVERDFSADLAVPGITAVPDRGITLKIELVNAGAVYNNQVNALDREKCAGPLELRNWRPGDRIHLKTSSSAEKIKTLFQEFRIPLWERRHWPVIAQGDTVLWTRQFGTDRSVAPGPESTAVLLIEETGESNRNPAASMEVKRARTDGEPSGGEAGAREKRSGDRRGSVPQTPGPGAEVL
jgi:tRNA(Ile)-lysidine synthase